MEYQFNTVEEALEELRAGHLILTIDDPDRENEGDLICAAQFATTENVNFMATHAKGLICTPMSEQVALRLGLEQMVKVNTDNHHTAFTVSIDHVDTTTGISAEERGFTCRKCADIHTKPEELRRPGHVFPLVARRGGVLTRNGHTEATVDLCRLAGLEQCGLCCEIMRDDGTMMRTSELMEKAKEWGLKIITIKDLQDYCRRHDIPVLNVCRSEQMMGIVYGVTFIQDIPDYYKTQGVKAYKEIHRMAPGTPNRDYTHHAIRILPVNSKLRSIVGDDTFDKVSSWHHQNILSVAGTGLIQTAEYTDQGLSLVEGVEDPHRKFAVGLQFHPENDIKQVVLNHKDPKGYADVDICLAFFKALIAASQK